ncbi:MAG TPA: VanZ family protein [Solirubrobacteraceae bacterium]|jgi:VanZ family protein|nr:VanZ family protein [Solirubrobacteraceae bacterium]
MGPVSRYGPPLAVMAIIFALSATPDLSSGLGTWDLILRKIAHIAVYGVLWIALVRATDWRRPLAATVIALLYAVSDEVHQTFVAGRHGAATDVAFDALGCAIAWLAWLLAARRRGRPGPPWPLRASAAGAATASRARWR